MPSKTYWRTLCLWNFLVVFMSMNVSACYGQLSYNFYDQTCPALPRLVRSTIRANLIRDVTAPAALLRLFFHDCQVQGCDGSILLNTQGSIVSELEAPANLGIRRLDFIDAIKASVENACPNTVSCADLVVLAGRDAVNLAGGPFIEVPLGRRDATTASSAVANAELPSGDTGFLGFLATFQSTGTFTLEESVALLGAHTLGVGHCGSVQNRLYPSKDPNLGLLAYNVLRVRCPPRASETRLAFVNDLTTLTFDTQYFSNALAGNGLFRVDGAVANNPLTTRIVRSFSVNQQAFFSAFSSAFLKLSLSNVLTGNQGEIRKNCRLVN